MLLDLLNSFSRILADATVGDGLVALGAGIAILTGAGSAIGEGKVVAKTIEGVMRAPELEGRLRSMMFIGVALVETTAIYALLVALLLIFVF
ncbi:MAG: ATP synthase F0 subunit C [Bacilli bacterium]|jgi:F-type H+-transporting ATPase subunit c|nr:ATP synthase F0 subunit C [Bacilli bacterium]